MSDKRFHSIIDKMFKQAELSDEEWIAALEVLDRPEKIDWLEETDQEKTHLFNRWVRNGMSRGVVDWFIEKHGIEIFTKKDKSSNSALNILFSQSMLAQRSASISYAVSKLISSGLEKEIVEVCEEEIEKMIEAKGVLFDKSPSFWDKKLRPFLYLLGKSQFDAAGEYLKKFPEVKDIVQDGHNVTSFMCVSERGWSEYMNSGGSIFDRVYLNPSTGESEMVGYPVWLWLMRKKIYHPAINTTLNQILTRISENRDVQEGEFYLSDDDWKLAVENKNEILAEKRMLEFEKEIHSDWKAARKANKDWRKWKSSEGANFMYWLATYQAAYFVKSAVNIKMNHKLIAQKDDLNRDIFSYLAIGALTSDWGSWRRAEKAKKESWPEAIKKIETYIDKDPEYGLLANIAFSTKTSYFGKLHSLKSVNSNVFQSSGGDFLYKIFKDNPRLLWNGFEENSLKVFKSLDTAENLLPIVSSALKFSLLEESGKERFRNFDTQTRFVLINLFAITDNMYGYNAKGYEDFIKEEVDKLLVEKIEIPLEVINIIQTFRQSKKSHYYKNPIVDSIDAMVMDKKIQSELHAALNGVDMNSTNKEEEYPQPKKRKM